MFHKTIIIAAIAPVSVPNIGYLPHNTLRNVTIQVDKSVAEQVDKGELDNIKNFTKKEIEDKIIAIIVDKLGVAAQDVKLASRIVNDLGADSLDTVDIIMEIEKVFSLSIQDELTEKVVTVENAVNLVYSLLKYPQITIFSDDNFGGTQKKIMVNANTPTYFPNLIKGGVSSIIVPKGYKVTLFKNQDYDYSGGFILINATDKKIKLKSLSEIKSSPYLILSKEENAWNDKIKSIKIEKIK
jgi:acyl carrier protein